MSEGTGGSDIREIVRTATALTEIGSERYRAAVTCLVFEPVADGQEDLVDVGISNSGAA